MGWFSSSHPVDVTGAPELPPGSALLHVTPGGVLLISTFTAQAPTGGVNCRLSLLGVNLPFYSHSAVM